MRRDIGCIDPHGMYPFPASRDVCPKCQAIRARRPSLRRGLPYGWWKDPEVLAAIACVFAIGVTGAVILTAWFMGRGA